MGLVSVWVESGHWKDQPKPILICVSAASGTKMYGCYIAVRATA